MKSTEIKLYSIRKPDLNYGWKIKREPGAAFKQ